MNLKKPDWGHWILGLVIVFLVLFLWLTPYHYRNMRGSPARISRISGEVEMWYPRRGWIKFPESAQPVSGFIPDKVQPKVVQLAPRELLDCLSDLDDPVFMTNRREVFRHLMRTDPMFKALPIEEKVKVLFDQCLN